jgi:hypothetical protein
MPRLGAWRDELDKLLVANEARPSRERLTLIRVFEALRRHCQVNCLTRALTRTTERAGDHGAVWPHVSCLQTLKILARAQRWSAAAIRWRRGRKWP